MERALWANFSGISLHTQESITHSLQDLFFSQIPCLMLGILCMSMVMETWSCVFPTWKSWATWHWSLVCFFACLFFSFGVVWPFILAHWPYWLIDQKFIIREFCHFTYKLQFSRWWRQQRTKKKALLFQTNNGKGQSHAHV